MINLKSIKVQIQEADGIYFNYLSYEINGLKILNKKFHKPALIEKERDFQDEQIILVDELVAKYVPQITTHQYIIVNIKTMIMEVFYSE